MPAIPYMRLYVGDYLGDTSHLSALQHGAYLLLIMAYWQKGGPLRNTDVVLSNISRTTPDEWQLCKEIILEFFTEKDGFLHHKRIDAELQKTAEISSKCREAIAKRWDKRNTDVLPTNNECNTTPISNSSNINNININVESNTDVLPPYDEKQKRIKHKYGEYANVLLTDSERDRLSEELGDGLYARVIAFYSAWKKEKGRVSKDDNLTIRRWVIEAVKKQEQAQKQSESVCSLPVYVPPPEMKALVDRHYAERKGADCGDS